MTDFLLELLSEEIPARMQAKARADLERLFAAELAAAGLAASAIETYSTPRRLALIARGLADETAPVREERRGPRADAPEQAIAGFLGSTGLARDQLETRDDKKGSFLYAVIETPGRPTRDVLAEAIPRIVRDFPWPKSMRWGAGALRWVRPLQGIVALFGGDVVPLEIEGISSGATTVGHRFRHPGPITIGGADDYAEKLRACHVILDHDERATIIRDCARALAAEAGLELVEDEPLVTENAALTEWPVPLLGSFDEAFLDVPPEVITLTMRTNQKYFALTNPPRSGEDQGRLAPHFICTANIDAADGGAAIVAGNRKVLAARLADARYFWEQDRKTPLAGHAQKLDQIVFHEKLGTVADKVERVAKLARWLVDEGIVKSSPAFAGEGDHPKGGGGARSGAEGSSVEGSSSRSALSPSTTGSAGGPPPRAELGEDLATLAETAACLCKADLVTQMVGEFPELQGVMGGHYARAEGLDPRIAAAIRDHYKPAGQGDEVPAEPVTVAVALADKLDTIVGFFAVGLVPSGSRDPFAVRRAALSVISLLVASGCRVKLTKVLDLVSDWYSDTLNKAWDSWDTADFWELFATEQNYRVEQVDGRAWLFHAQTPMVPLSESFAERQTLMDDMMARITAAPEHVLPFLAERLKVQQRNAGVRHDLIDAVFALGGEDDIVRLLARVSALQSFVETTEGADLLAAYKRAGNILKKEGWHREAKGAKVVSYSREMEESALIAALDSAEPRAAAAIEAEDFAGAMAALAALRGPIDDFFDQVTVNDPDPAKREARLAMLDDFRDAVHRVADFSKIEG